VCQSNVPFFPVILDGAPDSLWVSPEVKRSGICCDAKGPPPPRCVSFNVYLDKDAVGLVFSIPTGAIPPGALYYHINCGPPQKVGEVICLTGGRFYTLTFCEPGNNPNTYSIQSISGITGSSGLVTRADANCAGQLSYTGVDPSTVTWSVKSPNDQSLLRYLSCTNCTHPIFTPDSVTPPVIVYEVCGILLGTNKCNNVPISDCKEVTVTTLPAIKIQFDINPENICANDIPTIHAGVTPINQYYEYQWFSGPNGTGTVLSTNPYWTPQREGDYSLVVTETQSGILCNTATHNFQIRFDTLAPLVLAPPQALSVECNDPTVNQLIVNWLSTAQATDGTTIVPVSNNYSGIEQRCGTSLDVTFSVSDICGNVGTAVGTIHVLDTKAPEWLDNPGSLDVTLECSNSTGLMNAQAAFPIAYDQCESGLTPVKTSGAFIPGNCPHAGTYTNSWVVTDACGNSSPVFTQVITIVDTTRPTWTTAPGALNMTVECNDLAGLAAAQALAPAAADNCSPELSPIKTAGSFIPGACGATGSYTNSWTVFDECGNEVAEPYIQIITITDNGIPQITCPPNITKNANDGECFSAPVDLGIPLGNDVCNGAVSFSNDAPAQFPVGETMVTWTVRDACNNFNTCSQKVTVLDNQPPTISCPADILQIALPGDCHLEAVVVPDPVTSDNCAVVLQTWTMTGVTNGSSPQTGIHSVNGQTFNVGLTTVTYTIADASGNTASCSFRVTIHDQRKPEFYVCPRDTTVNAEDGKCTASLILQGPDVWDPCNEYVSIINDSPYRTSLTNASGTYPVGITIVTWTITDESGNVNTCRQVVTVLDNQPPSITCPSHVTAIAEPPLCEVPAIVVDEPVLSDNCETASLVLTWVKTGATNGTGTGLVNNTTFEVGLTTVTYTVTDSGGNSVSCSFTVRVNDRVPPVFILCPPDITLDAAPGDCKIAVTVPPPQVTDPCDEIVSVANDSPYRTSLTDASGTYPAGVHTITWTITDESGNTNTCRQIITIIDNQPPTITCPPNVTALATPPLCEVPAIDVENPVIDDNCDIANLVLTWVKTGATQGTGTGLVNNTMFEVGLTTVTYTVTDAAGNSASCSFSVRVNDKVPPVFILCPSDITLDAGPRDCELVVTVPSPEVTDPCDEIVSIANTSPFRTSPVNASGTYPVGVTVVTWIITDESGNINTCTQTITIRDYLPSLECPADIVTNSDFNKDYKSDLMIPPPVFSDNCPDSTLTWTKILPDGSTVSSPLTGINVVPSPDTYYAGVTRITYTFTDSDGHTVACSFTVTVLAKPVIECVEGFTHETDPGACSFLTDPGMPRLLEGAEPITWSWSMTGATVAGGTGRPIVPEPPHHYPFNAGTTTITWIASNTSGADTCTQTIIIVDREPPGFTPPGPFELCVEPMHMATYVQTDPVNNVLVNPDPDYYLLKVKSESNTMFDLDPSTFTDNCCKVPEDTFEIRWEIVFSGVPNPVPPHDPVVNPPISGTGQPSTYPEDIKLWGDGVTFLPVVHTIRYWLKDCNGNEVPSPVERQITIKPRPRIIKH
jgi:hypothetical protein